MPQIAVKSLHWLMRLGAMGRDYIASAKSSVSDKTPTDAGLRADKINARMVGVELHHLVSADTNKVYFLTAVLAYLRDCCTDR